MTTDIDHNEQRFRCYVCGHWCNPDNTGGWICDKRGGCGSEWLLNDGEES